MQTKITVIDYGVGNLLSVCRAFEHCGATVELTDRPERLLQAERVVLPGVGAFADAMEGLRSRNLIEHIKRFAETGRPFLGICLGMQMMLSESGEFGSHEGLGLINGKVMRIEETDKCGVPHKVPHIGWNQLTLPIGRKKSFWRNSILEGLAENSSTYFVHSYTAVPTDDAVRLADSFYGGRLISAVIRKDNLYGCQFHPEKSGKIGLQIIKAFCMID